MKYIDAEKLKYEIERREQILKKYEDSFEDAACCLQELSWMRSFIDSLQQEQPKVDLEEAAVTLEQFKSFMLQYLQDAASRKDDSEIEAATNYWADRLLWLIWQSRVPTKEQKGKHIATEK